MCPCAGLSAIRCFDLSTGGSASDEEEEKKVCHLDTLQLTEASHSNNRFNTLPPPPRPQSAHQEAASCGGGEGGGVSHRLKVLLFT